MELGQYIIGETNLIRRSRMKMKIIDTCKIKYHDSPTHYCMSKHRVPLGAEILATPEYCSYLKVEAEQNKLRKEGVATFPGSSTEPRKKNKPENYSA